MTLGQPNAAVGGGKHSAALTLDPMLFCTMECRYNDLVLAGRNVQGSGVQVLDSQEDSVTQRYREAVNNGFTTLRLFASGGEGNKALESGPGGGTKIALYIRI